jgi:hypothetical protein
MTPMQHDLLDETRRLADLIRRDAPSIATMALEPDGKYQTRPMALDTLTGVMTACLAEGFRGLAPADYPTLFCAWGKCRVGSTALTNLFGVAGLPSYYQPVKTIARHTLMGSAPAPWLLPRPAQEPHIFCKEMAGPYLLGECLFIPLQPLIEAGYPADKLHLIVLDREPDSSLASWLSKWSERVPPDRLVRNYVVAALNKTRVTLYARRQGVPVSHYVYEASKEPVQTVRALFDRLGLLGRFTESAVTDWKEMGALESEHARVIYPQEPPIYVVPGLHSSDTTYRYRARSASLTNDQQALLGETGVRNAYCASVRACAADLGLGTAVALKLFGSDITELAA